MPYSRFVAPHTPVTETGKDNPAEKPPLHEDVPQPPENPARRPPLYVAPKP